MKKRKYNESYLSFGFMDDDNCPQCVICFKVLQNGSMFPAKLHRHIGTVHLDYEERKTCFFKNRHGELLGQQKCIHLHSRTVNEKTTAASYIVSYHVTMAAYTIVETLIKLCIIKIVKCMLDENSLELVSLLPPLNDTISQRIEVVVMNVNTELTYHHKTIEFAPQMDEPTDVAGLAVLLVFVQYKHEVLAKKDLLCEYLPSNITEAEIFKILDDFCTENEVLWENCINICTDAVKAMVEITAGATA